jgi:SRSO17 transposase
MRVTASGHVGKQCLGDIGKIDNGVVSVRILWADERLYYRLEDEPYTPAHHKKVRKSNCGFRTKSQVALELVERVVEMSIAYPSCCWRYTLRRVSLVQRGTGG